MSQDRHFLIALGANLPSATGAPAATLRAALERLSRLGARGLRVSRFFRTPCFPPGAGPDYVNAAASLRFAGAPEHLLQALHETEAAFGRERGRRWGGRTLDLDLIAAGDSILPDPATQALWRDLPPECQIVEAPDRLIVPHPRLQDRAFVLIPLADVAPDWRHPLLQQSVREMLAALSPEALAGVVPLPGPARTRQ